MDDATLEGLIGAYAAAPSAPLALLIAREYAVRNDAAAIGPYVEALGTDVPADDRCHIARALIDGGVGAAAIPLLDATDPRQGVLLARALDVAGERERAREVYREALAANPELELAELSRRLLGGGTAGAERPRLRVVDKPDGDTVVNMDRYRAATTDFSDVVGLDQIKKQISKKIILPFQKPSLFARFRKRIGGGVLLYGPPGCGKTLLARATAGECKASFFNVEISDVLDMFIGESERNLHAIFEKSRSETPSVIFFDELEALAGKREFTRSGSNNNTVSQFLTELDGFSLNNEGVLVLASTNVPWAIDPAFLRPGRFDRLFFVPPPDRVAREGILRHHMRDRPTTGEVDFATLAQRTSGYSGADLANVVEMAADEAIEESIDQGAEVPISAEHFREALTQSRSTTTEWLTTARNYARYSNDGGRYDDVLEFLKSHGK